MVNINAGKAQCSLISRRVDRSLPDISFDSSSLEFIDKISPYVLTWIDYIISVSKAASSKLDFSFRTKRFFTPTELLTLYKAQICPCLEYCSHLWRGASKHSLATLDAIQRQVIRQIGDPTLTDTLGSLAHRRFVSSSLIYLVALSLNLFYLYYFCYSAP